MTQSDTITEQVDTVRLEFLIALTRGEPLVVVKAPPGSGKTRLILEGAAVLRNRGGRVAIAAQTNTQADDICRRLAKEFPFDVIRFVSGTTPGALDLGERVTRVTARADLPDGPTIAVGTASKWLFAEPEPAFDHLLIDEAWQLAHADLMLLDQVAARFVMVGDPGQIAPVVPIDTARWATSDSPPHVSAPELILGAALEPEPVVLELPATFRLPHDSVPLIRDFYDFHFEAAAQPGDRSVTFTSASQDAPVDPVLSLLEEGSICAAVLPTPPEGPPLEDDAELAAAVVAIAERMLERGGSLTIDDTETQVEARHIGFCATHRLMNARIFDTLPDQMKQSCMVDTAERWQGIEAPLMIIVHPVSGTTRPSTFDLQTERLCVMASRHKVGLVVVTRDHIGATLAEMIPSAEQHVGLPDATGAGLFKQRRFWEELTEGNRTVALDAVKLT